MRWRRLASLIALILAGSIAQVASARDHLQSRIAEVVAVMQGQRDPAKTFNDRFLAEVPPAKLRALAAQMTAQAGAITGYEDVRRERAGAATFTLRFAHGTAPARVELDPSPPGLVSGFRIFAVTPTADSFERLDADFATLPGMAGFAVYRLGDGAPTLVRGRAADTPFAVGSTFKLYVLAALAREVHDGTRRWSDVVPVSGKSFPGGTVHTLPDGAPVTLHTLASLMIAESDNTATDMLVRLVGQQALAREVRASGHAHPDTLAPLLTTAQFFALKRQGLAQGYAAAAPAERRRRLDALDLAAVASADPSAVFGHDPVAIEDVEWFASPADLAGAMDALRRLHRPEVAAILAINPALDPATVRDWAYVGYKGGSENGVISMTWLLRDQRGGWSVVTGSWNDPHAPVEAERFEVLMLRLAKLAR